MQDYFLTLPHRIPVNCPHLVFFTTVHCTTSTLSATTSGLLYWVDPSLLSPHTFFLAGRLLALSLEGAAPETPCTGVYLSCMAFIMRVRSAVEASTHVATSHFRTSPPFSCPLPFPFFLFRIVSYHFFVRPHLELLLPKKWLSHRI